MAIRPVTLLWGTIIVDESVTKLRKQLDRMAARIMSDEIPEGGLTYGYAAESMEFNLQQLQAIEATLQTLIAHAQANEAAGLRNPNFP